MMPVPPSVSVVIPTLNEATHIAATIAAARRDYGPEEVEVIVVDGGSRDGTPHLAAKHAIVLSSPPGRARQMNRGAAASRGQALLFCHGDTLLPAGWRDAVLEALARPQVSGGTFAIRFMPAQGLLHLLNWPRYPADWRLMYGDQGQFMARSIFERVGGYPEMPLLEDLEMMRRLHRLGRLVRLPLRVVSSSRRFLERGPLRQTLLNVGIVLRYLYLGASPEELARAYANTARDGDPN